MGGVGVELGKMGVLLIAKKVNPKRSHQKKKKKKVGFPGGSMEKNPLAMQEI